MDTYGKPAPGRARRAPFVLLAVTATVGLLAGCAQPGSSPTAGAPTSGAPGTLTVFPLDRQFITLDETLGLPNTAVSLWSFAQHLQYGDALGNGISAWVLAAGYPEPWRSDSYLDVVEAPPVHGRAASFLWEPADGDPARLAAIVFEWAPDAWASIFHHPADNDESVLLSLAESLRTDVEEPARFGLTVAAPAPLRWIGSDPFLEGADDPARLTGLLFDLGDGSLPPTEPWGDGPRVVVRVDYADEVWASEGELMEPNTTVGGHPAWVQDDTAAYTVYLLDEGRPAVSVSVHGEGAVDRFGPAQANELALSVQVLGSWTDRSQWTDNPLQ